MELDYSTGAGYKFQWLVSFYIYTLLKNKTYQIDNSTKLPNDFKDFRTNVLKFKNKCTSKFGSDFESKLEIMLEGEGRCFEDINLLADNNSNINDNLVFIQVKSKGGQETITRHDGILKAIKNFIENINYQKDKNGDNYLFCIFVNKTLAKGLITELKSDHIDLYISIIDSVIKNNNTRTTTKNHNYPNKVLEKLGDKYEITEKLLLGLKYNKSINPSDYTSLYNEEYIQKLEILMNDIKLVIDNLLIITSIKIEILINELENFYGRHGEDGYLDWKDRLELLSVNIDKIKETDDLFKTYKKFLYTYFTYQNNGKLINDMSSISKGKFI